MSMDDYLRHLRVESFDLCAREYSESSGAHLDLLVPEAMLREYAAQNGAGARRPDPLQFWRDSGLAERLQEYEAGDRNDELCAVLEALRGEIACRYAGAHGNLVRLSIDEVVKE